MKVFLEKISFQTQSLSSFVCARILTQFYFYFAFFHATVHFCFDFCLIKILCKIRKKKSEFCKQELFKFNAKQSNPSKEKLYLCDKNKQRFKKKTNSSLCFFLLLELL